MKVIDTPSSARSRYKVILPNGSFEFKQRFNTRTQSWYLDIATIEGTIIVKGRKMLQNAWLVTKEKHLFEDSNLAVVGYDNPSEPLGRNNLGSDKAYRLIYYTREDLE